jgi:hypothetical protein
MNKTKVIVKRVFIGIGWFNGKTIQEVKEHLDLISNNHIDMLYQGCTAKFEMDFNTFDDQPDLYLVFDRMETDKEYQFRMETRSKEIQRAMDRKYEEYLKLKEEFDKSE